MTKLNLLDTTLTAGVAVVYGCVWIISESGAPPAPMAAISLCLIWISVVDVQRFEIPDLASACLLLAALISTLTNPTYTWLDYAVGAIAWPLLFWFVGWLYLARRGRIGLGLGDVKLVSGLGLWLGFVDMAAVVLIAAVSGIASLFIFSMFSRRKPGPPLSRRPLAFGPFLCFSAWVIGCNSGFS